MWLYEARSGGALVVWSVHPRMACVYGFASITRYKERMAHRIQRSALLPYSAEQIFDLVDQVERYPEFVPGVVGSVVHSRDADELVASLTLQRMGVKLVMRTRNQRFPPDRLVMNLEDGPFRRFRAEWRFRSLVAAVGASRSPREVSQAVVGPVQNAPLAGVKVEFDAEFELAAVSFGGLAARLIDGVTGNLVGAFRQRAISVYGPA